MTVPTVTACQHCVLSLRGLVAILDLGNAFGSPLRGYAFLLGASIPQRPRRYPPISPFSLLPSFSFRSPLLLLLVLPSPPVHPPPAAKWLLETS